MTLALLDTLFMQLRQRGPTMTVGVAVFATEGHDNETDNKDNLKTHTFCVDGKIEFFIKFERISVENNTHVDICVTMRKKTLEKSTFGITLTSYGIKKCVQCTNESEEWREVSMGRDSFLIRKKVGSSFFIMLYKLYITITEVSMPMNNRLYEDTEFTDFQLHASDGSVAMHKAMLSVHSDMFKTMLRGEWKETAESRITMDGVTVQTLQHLKDYMYLGTLPDEGLEPLLLLAEHYLMDKLKADCIAKLVRSVKPENFEDILQFACQGSALTELVRALIFQVPDDVKNAFERLQINVKK